MSPRRIRWLDRAATTGLALVLVLTLALVPGGCRHRQQAEGQAAPDFVLPDLVGNQVSLSSLRGKPVVLTFWGST